MLHNKLTRQMNVPRSRTALDQAHGAASTVRVEPRVVWTREAVLVEATRGTVGRAGEVGLAVLWVGEQARLVAHELRHQASAGADQVRLHVALEAGHAGHRLARRRQSDVRAQPEAGAVGAHKAKAVARLLVGERRLHCQLKRIKNTISMKTS